jgi:hypothetical protein
MIYNSITSSRITLGTQWNGAVSPITWPVVIAIPSIASLSLKNLLIMIHNAVTQHKFEKGAAGLSGRGKKLFYLDRRSGENKRKKGSMQER